MSTFLQQAFFFVFLFYCGNETSAWMFSECSLASQWGLSFSFSKSKDQFRLGCRCQDRSVDSQLPAEPEDLEDQIKCAAAALQMRSQAGINFQSCRSATSTYQGKLDSHNVAKNPMPKFIDLECDALFLEQVADIRNLGGILN